MSATPNAWTFCERVVCSTELAHKLEPPRPGDATLDVEAPPPRRVTAPGRPPELVPVPGRAVNVPPIAGMRDPAQRARIVHALANHELQAVELFAWAVLAFPDAPRAFLAGLLAILADEQRHTRLYIERAEALGVRFGELPVTAHFWRQVPRIDSPLAFVCTMGLTFENANLDFAGELAAGARAADDEATAAVLDTVHADEVRHVRFGWRWLEALRDPDRSAWGAYLEAVPEPLGPSRARGRRFDRAAREAAGLDDEFIDALEGSTPRDPAGKPRR